MQDPIRRALYEAGCVLEGAYFFALKKRGLVSKKYINLDPIFTDPHRVRSLGRVLVFPFMEDSSGPDFACIVGPAIGGIPLVYATAFAAMAKLTNNQRINTAFAEKVGDNFRFDRMGFARAVKGRKTLIIEDISSSGDTTSKVAHQVVEAGGEPVGASLIWNRGSVTAQTIGVPRLEALVTERVETWDLSKENPPGWGELPLVSDIAHPEYFPDYPGGYVDLLPK